jgi:hypothetical protein
LSGLRGEAGTTSELIVTLPPGASVESVSHEGGTLPFTRVSPDVVTVGVRFDGERFARAQQVGSYDPGFRGGKFSARFEVPTRVFTQLAERQKAWPIAWNPEDFRTPWLVPHRLLLYVQIAEPDDQWDARLTIDGRQVELRRAYSAVRAARRTFVGFYAEMSLLQPDREYELELELPPLKPGQFQGAFFDHVETEYTARLARH